MERSRNTTAGVAKRAVAALCLLLLPSICAISQNIVVNNALNQSLEAFINEHLVGNGVTVSNATFNGISGNITTPQIGVFQSNGFNGLNMPEGVLMTTGNISVANGPNGYNNASSAVSPVYSDAVMDALSSSVVVGCATLDFDFICTASSVEFNYVFASEEYPEYVCSGFNDIFAFFIVGPDPETGISVSRNMAIIPGSQTDENPDGVAVAINSVNPGIAGSQGGSGDNCYYDYSEYYNSNPLGSTGIQYDGYTTKLVATAAILPNTMYHMHISICNIGDNGYDSGVFLEANSFSAPIHELIINGEESQSHNQEVTICLTDTVHFATSTTGTDTTVLWIIDGVSQGEGSMEMDHHFDTTGDHTVVALMHGLCYPEWCDTLMALVHIYAPSAEEATVVVCDSAYTFHDHTFSQTGDYSVIKPMQQGCDSAFVLHLTVNHSTYAEMADTVTENQLPLSFNGILFDSTVVHTPVILANTAGCDSTIDYSLHVYWNQHSYLDSTVCANMLPITWNGLTFSTEGTQETLTTTTHGADSLMTMTLTVNPVYSINLTETICNNQSLLFEGTERTEAAMYVANLQTTAGCDSVRTLTLTVNDTTTHTATVDVCDEYLWHGTTYTASAIDTFAVGPNSQGCDSTDYLNLTIRYSSTSAYWDTMVQNNLPRLFNNNIFADSVSHTMIVVTNTAGCDSTIDYSLHVHWNVHTDLYDEFCNDSLPITWNGVIFDTIVGTTAEMQRTVTYASHTGSDSTVTMHVIVHPLFDQHVFDTIYDGDTYQFEQQIYDTTGIYPVMFSTVFGCDSLRTLHLQRNRRTYVDSVVCQNALPLVWNGAVFTEGSGYRGTEWQTMSDSVHLTGLAGIDSLVVMTVTANDTSATYDIRQSCDSLLWRDGTTYYQSTTSPYILLQNHMGCDSIRHLTLTVNRTGYYTDSRHGCDSLLWRDGNTYFRDTASIIGPLGSGAVTGPVDTLETAAGCDSVIGLDLAIHYSFYTESIDTFCHDQTYRWRGHTIFSDSTYSTIDYYIVDSLESGWKCDSVIAIRLTKMARPQIAFLQEIDCQDRQYKLAVGSDRDYYTYWSTIPPDSDIEGLEEEKRLVVSPDVTTEYHLYVDYHETPLCPVSEYVTLRPVVVPTAEIRVNPEALTYKSLHFAAIDLSKQVTERAWYIDWHLQSEKGGQFEGYAPATSDTVNIALSVFNGQCWDTASLTLPILRVAIFAPNAFTPGSGDENSRFTLTTQGITEGELRIYNREGNLVYSTKSYDTEGWDGGKCRSGNYVWRFDYHAIDYPETRQTEVGTVLLIR